MNTVEANFDGLVGPTHNYAGLAFGNVASERNRAATANPREAAMQGLQKMRAMHELGLSQGVIPPQERPHLPTLRRLGFSGSDHKIIGEVARRAPDLLAIAHSASSMWTANAATVSPSADTSDRRVHFTPANLCGNLHRSIEADASARILAAIFPSAEHFVHHTPLCATPDLGDEGAANHTRFCDQHGEAGLEFFVYGRGAAGERQPRRYPARQTRMACEAVARLHELNPERVVYAQQNPDVIDQGVFHNDVIAVGNRNLLFYHEHAFVDGDATVANLRNCLPSLIALKVPDREVSVAQAVNSYLFNSQLISLPDGGTLLVVASECREEPAVWNYIQELVGPGKAITESRVFDLRQSMRNGGGPACLRLRVALTDEERQQVTPGCWINDNSYKKLSTWVQKHYRDRLQVSDLADPALLDESRTALDELSGILGIGHVYEFQRG